MTNAFLPWKCSQFISQPFMLSSKRCVFAPVHHITASSAGPCSRWNHDAASALIALRNIHLPCFLFHPRNLSVVSPSFCWVILGKTSQAHSDMKRRLQPKTDHFCLRSKHCYSPAPFAMTFSENRTRFRAEISFLSVLLVAACLQPLPSSNKRCAWMSCSRWESCTAQELLCQKPDPFCKRSS